MKRYRIANKFRFTVFTVTVLLVFSLVFSNLTGLDCAYSDPEKTYISVEVVSGDTLWDLARTYGPADKDVRLVVKDICAINEVSAYTLRPGQSLLIPQS